MNATTGIFAGAVLDRLVIGKVFIHAAVEAAFIGIEDAFPVNVLGYQIGYVDLGCLLHMESPNATATLYKAKDGALV